MRHKLRHLRAGLITLTGAGGSGKTRLAFAVAETVLDEFPDGVWVVDLASLQDAELVPAAVLATIGVREHGGQQPGDALVASIATRDQLLVLDNCEHLAKIVRGVRWYAPGAMPHAAYPGYQPRALARCSRANLEGSPAHMSRFRRCVRGRR